MPPPSHLLPKPILLNLLPASFEPWGSIPSFLAAPPTPQSIRRINAELQITLPPLFIEIATACPAYGGWFNSIGEDYTSHLHILAANQSFRAEGLPSHYILLNHGHDGDCDAWDTHGTKSASNEFPIVYFNFDTDSSRLNRLSPSAPTFADYLDTFIRHKAPRCPAKNLRRHAKRILAEFQRHEANATETAEP